MRLSKQDWLILIVTGFGLSYGTALWGAFELAVQSGSHPVWSGTWGYPVPHHYLFGFGGVLVCFIVLCIVFVKEK